MLEARHNPAYAAQLVETGAGTGVSPAGRRGWGGSAAEAQGRVGLMPRQSGERENRKGAFSELVNGKEVSNLRLSQSQVYRIRLCLYLTLAS